MGPLWSSAGTAVAIILVVGLVSGNGTFADPFTGSSEAHVSSLLSVTGATPISPCNVLPELNSTLANGSNSSLFPLFLGGGEFPYPGNFSGSLSLGAESGGYYPNYGTPGNLPPSNGTNSPPPPPPVNLTANATVGQIRTLWDAICQEPTFASLTQQIGGTNASELLANFSLHWRGEIPAGPIVFVFEYSWTAACDASLMSVPSNASACTESEFWLGNVSVQGALTESGPFVSEAAIVHPPSTGPPPIIAPSPKVGMPAPLSHLGRILYGTDGALVLVGVGIGGVVAVGGGVAFARKRGSTVRRRGVPEDGARPPSPNEAVASGFRPLVQGTPVGGRAGAVGPTVMGTLDPDPLSDGTDDSLDDLF